MGQMSKKYLGINPSTTLSIDAKFKEMAANGIDVVGFGAGEPDFDTPEHIKEAAIEAIKLGMTKYTPAAGSVPLRQAICRKLERENGLSYKPSQIVVSNGAKHSLNNALGAILNPGDDCLLPAPYWVSYEEMIKLADGVPNIVHCSEQQGFKVTVEQLTNAITPKTRALILNSPSNPTGMRYDEHELEQIAKFAVDNKIYVISDEIYEHIIYEGKHTSIASYGDEIKDLTVIVNGVSKTFAMTGWRVGYTASNQQLATVMGNVQSHMTSNPNSIAQHATIAALDGGLECVAQMNKAFVQRRDYMVERINNMQGVSCMNTQGAFYLMMNISKLKGKTLGGEAINSSDDFARVLLEKALVAVVPCSGFGADDYVRWSYAVSMETIKKGLDRLEELLK